MSNGPMDSMTSSIGMIFQMRFVCDGKATFKIEPSAEPPYRSSPSDIQQESAKLHVLVKDVHNLQCCKSPAIVVRDISWEVMVKRNDESLAILRCHNRHGQKLDVQSGLYVSLRLTKLMLEVKNEQQQHFILIHTIGAIHIF